MEPTLAPEHQNVVDAAASFACEVVAPQAAAWEQARSMPVATLRAAAEAGLTGLLLPAEAGGHGLSYTAMARVMEEMAAADMAFAFSLVVHNNLMGNIAANGDAAQQARHLPALLAGERIGAFLLTEPSGGSDAAAIRTRAVRDGDGWRLNGAKAWVTNAAHADLLSVYAQTDPDEGWRGIACFLVDAEAPGVVREPP